MKAKQISLLILSVVAALALLCAVFPGDGIDLGFAQLRFPGLIEVLQGDSTDFIDPEEQMARLAQEQMALMYAKDDSAYITKLNQSETKIWFPNDDMTYFDTVFAALDNASKKHVRIIHYGDSQIELDRMSCDLREMLQSKFGGHGKGWIPIVPIAGNNTLSASCAPRLYQGFQYSFFDETKPRDSKGGPYATTAYLTGGTVTVTVRCVDAPRYQHVHGFDRVKVLTGSNGGTLAVKCGNASAQVSPNKSLTVTSVDIDSTSSAKVSISGSAHLYGILLDSRTGVAVDNVPMRGCTGNIFTLIAKEEVKDFFAKENVPLVILQFGGNVTPLINNKNLPVVLDQLRSQIEYFQEVAPGSRILFIGPSDMATRRGGTLHTYTNLPMYVDALKAMCLEAGVAYWDMFAVMGGQDSMVSWEKNGWAGSDYIHFSTEGAQRMTELFNNSFMLYYDYYTFRHNNKKQ